MFAISHVHQRIVSKLSYIMLCHRYFQLKTFLSKETYSRAKNEWIWVQRQLRKETYQVFHPRLPLPISAIPCLSLSWILDHFQWFPSNASDRRLDPSLLERKQWQSNPAVILRSVAALLNQNKLPAVVKLSRNHTDCGSWCYYQMIAREIEDWPDRWWPMDWDVEARAVICLRGQTPCNFIFFCFVFLYYRVCDLVEKQPRCNLVFFFVITILFVFVYLWFGWEAATL